METDSLAHVLGAVALALCGLFGWITRAMWARMKSMGTEAQADRALAQTDRAALMTAFREERDEDRKTRHDERGQFQVMLTEAVVTFEESREKDRQLTRDLQNGKHQEIMTTLHNLEHGDGCNAPRMG